MKFCPNYKNKEVFDGFNEMVESFGGAPLSEEEFRSSELRNQRTGRDFSAMEATYMIYDKNNGNLIDRAPNGEPSILFQKYLEKHNGNRAAAIIEKSEIYSEDFVEEYGDWQNMPTEEEMQVIKERAIADGTFMKAPNGKPTNLTERQWLQVRTKAFKDWFGDWEKVANISSEIEKQLSLVFERNPELSKVGSIKEYAAYLADKFPNSVDKNIYWHGTNEDMSEGFKSAKKGKGSGAPETQTRNDFYLAKQAWTVLQYINGVNRNSVDKNGFAHWNKLWWELKEIMSNGRRENNDWKDMVIGEETVRQGIPNKKGVFNRDKDGENGKWLKERKADYGYENKSDKEFFEDILGIQWGKDTFNTWTKRNAEVFKSLEKTQKGIYPAIINTQNPIREKGQNTYYEELRGLFTQADREGNDAILGELTDNEFGSDVAVVLNASEKNVHFLGTKEDIEGFKKWLEENRASKVVDENGEPLVVYHFTDDEFTSFKASTRGLHFTSDSKGENIFFPNPNTKKISMPVFLNIKNPAYEWDAKYWLNKGDWSTYYKLRSSAFERGVSPSEKKERLQKANSIFSTERTLGNEESGIGALKKVDSAKDGIIRDNYIDYIAFEPNQIKSATNNNGKFSTENDNIRYRTKLDINGEPDLDVVPAKQKPSDNKSFETLLEVDAENLVEKADINSFFGSLYDVLLSGNAVSSQSLVQLMLSNKTISAFNKPLINALLLHDIPVIFKSLDTGEVAAIYIDKSGQTVIAIDPIMASKVSNLFLSEQIIHEIVHGVTLREWDNPQTKEGKALKKNTLDLFNLLTKIYPEYNYSRLNVNNVSYALSDPREFVAVYMSDDAVRNTFMAKAKELDRQKNSKLMLALKKFINSVTNFLVNKNVFNLALDKLNLYQNQVILYIFAMPQIRKGNITDKQLEDAIYNRTSETVKNYEQLAESAKTILFYFDNADRFNSLTTIIQSAWDNFRGVLDVENKHLSKFREYASSALARRALGAKSSKMAPDVKLRAQRVAEAQSKMFAADETQISSFDAIAQFLDQLTPQLLEDLKYIKTYRTETGTWRPMDESEYGYYVHNTFYAYDAILQQLSSALNNIREEDLGRNTTDPNSIIKSYKDIKKACEICRSLVSESIDYLINIMRVSGRDILELIGRETNSLDMMAYLEDYGTLDTIDYDTNKFIIYVGSIDGAKDEILRALSTIVTNANHSADRQAYSKVSELLKLIGELKMTESIKSLYELDEDGNTTQYMVRELNFGKFWNRYNDFLKKLNKKYGLGEENRRSPDDEEIREKWNKERNDWLSKNCHRKYVPEYYAAYNKISYLTEQTRNRINSEINAIKAKYTLPNGELDKFPDFTDEDFTRLLSLYSERERCKSLYTEQNTLKVEGTPEYQIAVEWRQLDEDLKALREKYGSHEDLLAARNVELWRQRRNAIIEECGGKAEMDKGIEGNFDFNKLRDWDIKHSRLQWKRDSDGNVKLFAEIERGMRGNTPLYEVNGDGGALYNKLKERKLDLLRPARYKSNGEVDPNLLSISTRIELKKIDNEIKRVLNIAKQQNPALAAMSKVYGEQIQKRVLFIGSRLWEKARQLAALAGEDVYELFETTTGFYIDEDDIEYRINSWFLRPVEKPEYYGKYIELIPGDFYIDYEQDNVLKDKEYQKYEDYGVSMVPKKVSDDGYSYDNSAAYKKIQNSKTLKAVYEAALEVNRQISENYETKFDMWLLPSITGTLNKKIKKKSGKGSGIGQQVKTSAGVLAEHVGNKFGIAYELGMMEDVDFGQTLEQLVSQFDESGFLQEAVFGSSMYGAKADGSDLGVIPKYYLGKLKDPTQVSWDLADMLYQSVRQSYRYKERSLVKDKCDLLLDILSKRKYQNPTKKLNLTSGKLQYTNANVSGEKTGTYNAAKKFLDRNMYNRRALRGRQEFNIFNHNIVVNWGKLGSLFRNIAVLVNLGFKPTIAMAGLLTAAHVHLMNAITGSITGGARYSGADFAAAFALTTWEAVKSLSEGSFVANNRSGNKLQVLMEHFNVSDQAGKKFKRSNWNRAQRVAKSVTSGFSFLSACDFIIKSNIMTAVLLSYRYYEGEFQTEEDVRFANRNKSKEELRNIIKDFKHSKSLYTLLKVKEFTNEDGQKVFDVVVDDEYKKAYDDVENVVHSRILKYAENADGIPTEEQKSQISTNFLGACVIMHRQYLPLMLQERYGPTVWDNDTRQYNQGQFRSVGTALVNCLKYSIVKPGEEMNQDGGRLESAVMNGLLLGMLGTFFAPIFGPFACLITGAIGTVGGALSYKAYNKVFKNNQNKREYLLSRTRRQHLVRTIAEISYYRMYAWLVQYIISPWIEDEKDWYLLQMLMFSLHKYQWEQFNAYRFDDVLLNFKSASAATNLMDRVKEGLQATPAVIYNSITQRANLGDKYMDFSDNSELDEYSKTYRKNSAYGRDIPFTNTRWTKGTKALFEMVPASNLYKDYYGARQKDNYFKHQIMHQK